MSISTIKDGISEVKSTAGDTYIGGEYFDNQMVNHFIAEYKHKQRRISVRTRAVTFIVLVNMLFLPAVRPVLRLIHSLYKGIDFYTSITHT